jgi:ribosomal-protein-alanine N-acetyltransferase
VDALRGDLVSIRPLTLDDAGALLDLRVRNNDFLAEWEPRRPADWLTPKVQRADLRRSEDLWAADRGFHFAIVHDGSLVGRIALNEVVRGSFQNAYLGYWIDEASGGNGYATDAVRLILRFAFDEARLHRVQAAVMPRNAASIRVLEKAGFRREGIAARYLRIADAWEDHILFARTAEDR